MSSYSFEKVVGVAVLIIIMVLLLLWAYGPNGSFTKAKDSTHNAKNFVDIGVSETPGTKPAIPSSHEKVIMQLKKTITLMHNAKESYCFARYNERIGESGFPDLGEEGTSLVLASGKNKEGKEGMSIKVLGGVGGIQEVSYEFIEGVKPCVIAGTRNDAYGREVNVAGNFYEAYVRFPDVPFAIKKESMLRDYAMHYFPVETLTITRSSGLDATGNAIRATVNSALGLVEINDEGNNLLDGGLLYTPDKKHICFFPTTVGDVTCSGDDPDGLDDDCLGADLAEEGNLIRQFTQEGMRPLDTGYLLTCSSS
ncbi:hypothetical protein HYV86_05955 [Candidatus Woesearchaeota archaeon]|nr:hypothetical protein [Candidatus Woesearchaeota archaeon]